MSGAPRHSTDGAATGDDDILALEDELRAAMLRGDVAALDRLVDEDLVFVTQTGGVATKAEDLDSHRSGTLRLSRLDPSERRVRHLGDAAVVTVRMELEGTFARSAFAGAFRYTRVWARRGDGWRVVAGHVSQIAD